MAGYDEHVITKKVSNVYRFIIKNKIKFVHYVTYYKIKTCAFLGPVACSCSHHPDTERIATIPKSVNTFFNSGTVQLDPYSQLGVEMLKELTAVKVSSCISQIWTGAAAFVRKPEVITSQKKSMRRSDPV